MSFEVQQLSLQPHQHDTCGLVFDLWVDNQPYLNVLKQYESRFAGRIAGQYQAGLKLKSLIDNQTTITPYVCTCSEPECWFITASIEIVQDTTQTYVIWHRWNNPFRSDKQKIKQGLYWDYSNLTPLIFEQKQYNAEIAHASHI